MDPNQAPRGAETAPADDPATTRRERTKPLERFALLITNAVGTIWFFFAIFAWTAVWLAWNALGPRSARFDPFPGFVLWLFLSNMIQLFLMPLIMVGQNIQSRAADKRAEADLKVNRTAEEEIQAIRGELAELTKMLASALDRGASDPSPRAPS
ncbi:MAG: DUF1003 domain-containing protein [Gemmatimonadota bacterium]|nr:DUF1003 domain-containing protein [Gemmatimonadota bacterium]